MKLYERSAKLFITPEAQIQMFNRFVILNGWDCFRNVKVPKPPKYKVRKSPKIIKNKNGLGMTVINPRPKVLILDFCFHGTDSISPVEMTMRKVWKAIFAPDGVAKEPLPDWLDFDEKKFKLLNNCEPGLNWRLFDPFANTLEGADLTGKILSYLNELKTKNLASYQVMIGALFFPNWIRSTAADSKNPQPVMAGCRIGGGNGKFSDAPLIHFCSDKKPKLELKVVSYMGGNFINKLCSPTIERI
jgi:hypothetical protein